MLSMGLADEINRQLKKRIDPRQVVDVKGRITYTVPEPVEIKNISELGNGEEPVFLLICPSKQVNFRQYNRIERAGCAGV